MLQRYAAYRSKNMDSDADLSTFGDYEDISDWALNGLKWAVANGIISGHKDTEVPTIKPLNNTTRAETATMITRFCQNLGK